MKKVLFVESTTWRRLCTFESGKAYEVGDDLYAKYVEVQHVAVDLPEDFDGEVLSDPRSSESIEAVNDVRLGELRKKQDKLNREIEASKSKRQTEVPAFLSAEPEPEPEGEEEPEDEDDGEEDVEEKESSEESDS